MKKTAFPLLVFTAFALLATGCGQKPVSSTPGGSSTTSRPGSTYSRIIPPSTYVPPSTSYKGLEKNISKSVGSNGDITVVSKATGGTEVTITCTPNAGYMVKEISVSISLSGKVVFVRKDSQNIYKFTMPDSAVKVTASFTHEEPYYDYVKTPTTKGFELLGYKNGIDDEAFRKGFIVRKKKNVGGDYAFNNKIRQYEYEYGYPTVSWEITQWMSQSLIDSDTPNYYLSQNGTKNIIRDKETGYAKSLEFDTATGDFKMVCDCTHEYKDNKQEYYEGVGGNWWVHFLIEQAFPKTVKLSECKELMFNLDYTLTDYEVGSIFSGAADCAQAEWFFIIKDTKRQVQQWFGFDLWDNRYPGGISGEYKQGEYGSGTRILRASSTRYIKETGGVRPTNEVNGKTFHIQMEDALTYIKEDFDKESVNGYWKGSNWEDLEITSTNIGFEIHNHFKAGFLFQGMGCYYK